MVAVQRKANSSKDDRKSEMVVRMQKTLDRLGIPLVIAWNPKPNMTVHGEIRGNVLCIYDVEADEVLATFTHEVIEFKLKDLTRIYRTMINSLIDGYEKTSLSTKRGIY